MREYSKKFKEEVLKLSDETVIRKVSEQLVSIVIQFLAGEGTVKLEKNH